MKKRALCLQGGGAKGAFQAGALKALTERGYKYDCAVGASVGALNAAMYALGKTDELFDLWKELDFPDVLPVERKEGGEKLSLLSIASSAIGAIRSGVDTVKIRAIIEKYVDEDALRASSIRFGLVTVQDGKPRVLRKLFIEDIPQGKLVDVMMASAALPFFKKVEIDGIRYFDGGMMDNLPIAMLAEAGYRDVTAIRLGGDIRYAGGPLMKITYIDPSESPGHTVLFANSAISRSLQLGYYDVLRMLDGLCGKKYYIKPFGERKLLRSLKGRKERVKNALETVGVAIGGRFKEQLALLTYVLSEALGVLGDFKEVWIAFAEYVAKENGINRWRVYTMEELLVAASKGVREEEIKEETKRKAIKIARVLFGEERQ